MEEKRRLQVSGAYIWYDDTILTVQRHPLKNHGEKWSMVTGKLKKLETPLECIVREVKEEVDIKTHQKDWKYLGMYDFEFPDSIIEYHTFETKIEEKPEIRLNKRELMAFDWQRPELLYASTNLIAGFKELLVKTNYV